MTKNKGPDSPLPVTITSVEQLLNDETHLPYVPTSADVGIIGEPLAQQLGAREGRIAEARLLRAIFANPIPTPIEDIGSKAIESLRRSAAQLTAVLNDRERAVLRGRFGRDGKKLETVCSTCNQVVALDDTARDETGRDVCSTCSTCSTPK